MINKPEAQTSPSLPATEPMCPKCGRQKRSVHSTVSTSMMQFPEQYPSYCVCLTEAAKVPESSYLLVCPKCGGPISGNSHGTYCQKDTCKWGWEVEMDGSPLKPPAEPLHGERSTETAPMNAREYWESKHDPHNPHAVTHAEMLNFAAEYADYVLRFSSLSATAIEIFTKKCPNHGTPYCSECGHCLMTPHADDCSVTKAASLSSNAAELRKKIMEEIKADPGNQLFGMPLAEVRALIEEKKAAASLSSKEAMPEMDQNHLAFELAQRDMQIKSLIADIEDKLACAYNEGMSAGAKLAEASKEAPTGGKHE